MSATELGTTKPKQQLTWRLQRRNWCPSPTHAVGGCPPRPRLWCRRSRPTAGDTALRCSRGGAGALPAKVKRGMLSRQRASFPRKKTNVAFDEHPQRKPHRSFRHRSSEHSPCRTEEVCTWIHRVALRPCNRCLDGSERHKNDQPCFLVKERHRTGNPLTVKCFSFRGKRFPHQGPPHGQAQLHEGQLAFGFRDDCVNAAAGGDDAVEIHPRLTLRRKWEDFWKNASTARIAAGLTGFEHSAKLQRNTIIRPRDERWFADLCNYSISRAKMASLRISISAKQLASHRMCLGAIGCVLEIQGNVKDMRRTRGFARGEK